MESLFKQVEISNGLITLPLDGAGHVRQMTWNLVAEASGGFPDESACRMIELETVEGLVRAAFCAVEARATEWLKPIMEWPVHSFKAPPGHADSLEILHDLRVRRIADTEGAVPPAINCSFAAVGLYLDAILESDMEPLKSADLGVIFGCLGVYFIELYLSEPGSIREVHLAQAGECLYIAGINNFRDEAGKKDIEQKRMAGVARHARWYGPLQRHAEELYDAGLPWESVRAAAVDISPKVLAFAAANGLAPSKERNFQTVYEWLLKHANATK